MKQFGFESVLVFVMFLVSDDVAYINGQAFVVYGGLIQLLQGWQTVAAMEKDDGWRLVDVRGRISELFKSAPPKLFFFG